MPNLIISSYSSDLYGDIQEFEIRYRRVRRQIKSVVYSIAIRQGGELFQKFYDYSYDACLDTFLELRLRDMNEYEEFISFVFNGNVNCRDFKVRFKNYRKTVEELILIIFNSIQDYVDNKMFVVYPTDYDFVNNNTPNYQLYYPDGYDSEREDFFYNYNTWRIDDGTIEKYYS